MRSTLPLLQRRALSIALGLLLLITQQLGLQHLLSHALGGAAPAAASVAAGHASLHATSDDSPPADKLCQVCLALAAIGLAALPASWRWRAPRLPTAALARWSATLGAARSSAPYLARAPPAPQA